MSKPDFKC